MFSLTDHEWFFIYVCIVALIIFILSCVLIVYALIRALCEKHEVPLVEPQIQVCYRCQMKDEEETSCLTQPNSPTTPKEEEDAATTIERVKSDGTITGASTATNRTFRFVGWKDLPSSPSTHSESCVIDIETASGESNNNSVVEKRPTDDLVAKTSAEPFDVPPRSQQQQPPLNTFTWDLSKLERPAAAEPKTPEQQKHVHFEPPLHWAPPRPTRPILKRPYSMISEKEAADEETAKTPVRSGRQIEEGKQQNSSNSLIESRKAARSNAQFWRPFIASSVSSRPLFRASPRESERSQPTEQQQTMGVTRGHITTSTKKTVAADTDQFILSDVQPFTRRPRAPAKRTLSQRLAALPDPKRNLR